RQPVTLRFMVRPPELVDRTRNSPAYVSCELPGVVEINQILGPTSRSISHRATQSQLPVRLLPRSTMPVKPQHRVCASQETARRPRQAPDFLPSHHVAAKNEHVRKPDTATRGKGEALIPHGPLRKADADLGERTVKVAVVGFTRINAAIHRVEEEVRAIAEANFGVSIAKRKTSEATNIGHRHSTGAGGRTGLGRADNASMRITAESRGLVILPGVVMDCSALPAEQDGTVDTPIKAQLA